MIFLPIMSELKCFNSACVMFIAVPQRYCCLLFIAADIVRLLLTLRRNANQTRKMRLITVKKKTPKTGKNCNLITFVHKISKLSFSSSRMMAVSFFVPFSLRFITLVSQSKTTQLKLPYVDTQPIYGKEKKKMNS